MGQLRVVTWNVHGCRGPDGVRDPERVAAVLRRMTPDVVGLQEVDSRILLPGGSLQLNQLARATGLTPIAGPTLHTAHGHFGNALLTTLPVEAVIHHDLSVGRREPRGLLDVALRGAAGQVRVLVTHFGLKIAERRAQVALVLEALATADAPRVLLLGDFNEWRPRAAAVRQFDAVLGAAPRLRTFPSILPVLALDRIWARPARALASVQVCRWRAAAAASDHLPVTAELLLPTA